MTRSHKVATGHILGAAAMTDSQCVWAGIVLKLQKMFGKMTEHFSGLGDR